MSKEGKKEKEDGRKEKKRKEGNKKGRQGRKKNGKKERTTFESVRGSSNSSLGMYKRNRIYTMNILIPIFKYGDGDLRE